MVSVEISEDEAALYDRQIRLWGLDAQKRLRASRILLVGLRGLGAEVAKNIVLAGVKSLTLMDNSVVTEEDFASNFLISRDDLKKNRAVVCVANVQQLNPMVDVLAEDSSVGSKQDDYFKNFDVVILLNCSQEEMVKINGICRKYDIKFFAGNVWGFFGYAFSDLQEHEYAEEIPQAAKPSGDSIPSKMQKITKTVKKISKFIPLEDALTVNLNNENNIHNLKTISSSYFILKSLLKFQSTQSRNPLLKSKAEDITALQKISDEILDKYGINREKLDSSFANNVFAELSPVCAIVGGVLAQEVVKAVSSKDAPHKNFFFYNGLDGSGIVENIGS